MEDIVWTAVLYGTPRTKKNHSDIKFGKIVPSQAYYDYKKDVLPQIRVPKEIINYPVICRYTFWLDKKIKVDGLNLCAALDDILVEAGVLEDDNRNIVAGHDGTRVYVDPDNPRVEITITKAEKSYISWVSDKPEKTNTKPAKIRTKTQKDLSGLSREEILKEYWKGKKR